MLLKVFRLVAFIEGVTTLALFLIAMPMKYLLGQPGLIPMAGWAHGIAFIAYAVTLPLGLWGRGLTLRQWLRTVFAAFVPFGTFLNDPMLERAQAKMQDGTQTALGA